MLKIFMIESKWTEDGKETDNPICFIKAESGREADRVFRRGFMADGVHHLTVLKVQELTLELLYEKSPDEFMLHPSIEF